MAVSLAVLLPSHLVFLSDVMICNLCNVLICSLCNVMFCREFPELSEQHSSSSSNSSNPSFKLALHCGGCMIDAQKMRARIADLEDAGVPVTNYGLFLSYVQSPAALRRVLEPWGVHF